MRSRPWLTAALAAALFAQGCAPRKLHEVDELFCAYSGQVPGAAVMVVHKGRPILTRCYGLASLEQERPVGECTNFRLASVSKQFTAMGIMILVEGGLLRYGQTLRQVFPAFPPYGDAVTIDHLLHHTSGLIEYESLLPDTMTSQVSDADVLRMMMEQDSTYFPPGNQFRYSNAGYAVLAMVVGKVSGMRFADFLRENVFLPAGMTSTIAYEKGVPPVSCRA
jgi:CubicO group peptidase (beta-lactamase class C family)